MPGRRLNDTERHLLQFWSNPPRNFQPPLLRRIAISGAVSLRGVRQLAIPFNFPLTAICGKNGVGKSTVLGLAALSARAPQGWRVYWGNTRPRTTPNARPQYTFTDFFHRRAGDPGHEGLQVNWISIVAGDTVEIAQERRGSRWLRLIDPGRQRGPGPIPSRAIDFVPIGRILPASEVGPVRRAFAGVEPPDRIVLTERSLTQLSYIMGRQYQEADIRFSRGLGLPTVRTNARYSGFDMGSGESSLVALLARLQDMPFGGLAVIEELELGLHAEAQARLIEVLLQLCSDRRLQLICTTHSEVVLDHLPREARLLLRRNGDQHEAIGNISTRFAVHEMSGAVQPELVIYVEDVFAGIMVEEALPGNLRSRVRICDIGSNTTLARQAVAHLRAQVQPDALSLFDGDNTTQEIDAWIANERGHRAAIDPPRMLLPGNGLAPERWLVNELPVYLEDLARELNCDVGTAGAHVQAMRVQLDHHHAGRTLSLRTGLAPVDAERKLIRALARRHPALDAVRDRVRVMIGA